MFILVMVGSRMNDRDAVGDQRGAICLGGGAGAILNKNGDRPGTFRDIGMAAGDVVTAVIISGNRARGASAVAPGNHGRKILGGQIRIGIQKVSDDRTEGLPLDGMHGGAGGRDADWGYID